ncbi:hypothetical protein IJ114_01730 [Candidatus Saccharibacteria bacterium]|nr:hypothetical protein [Candidatus Saccharibacteria bacterium]
MYQSILKNKSFKVVACCIAAVLALFSIYTPKAFAAESYFVAEGGTLEFDNVDPERRTVSVKLKASREMTIHSLEGYFTPVDNDEELEYGFGDISAVFPGMGGNRCSLSDGWFYWSAEEFMDPSISSEGIHVQAGDDIFEVAYDVKDGVEVMKRSMPVTLDLAVIDDGTETGKQIQNITMDTYVRAGHDLSVYKYIMGNGDLNVPNIVVGGTDVEVGIVPEPGNELVYLELNGQEVTDQIQDNVFRVTPGTESLTFYANFHRVYPVLEGDGGEHIIGSEEPLVFKIDNDVTTFCDTGVLIIDGEYLDMRTDCKVDPDNQTITLPASFLNTVGLGEHSFEAWFSEPESGSAKASFKIIEASSDKSDTEDDDGAGDTSGDGDGDETETEGEVIVIVDNQNEDSNHPSVPNTGLFTDDGGSVAITNTAVLLAAVVGFVATVGIAIKRTKRN